MSKRFLGFCAVTCLLVAQQNCFSQINTEIDFKKCILEKCWDAWASKTVNNDNKKGWYSMSRYSKSIYECIATAIADCITEKGQFTKSHIEDDYVAFDVKPDMINYGPEHWNALVLYNFLYWTIGLGKIDPDNDGVEAIGASLERKLEKQYSLIADIGEKIDKAVSDIKRYAEALNLHDFLNRLKYWKNKTENKSGRNIGLNFGYDIPNDHFFDPKSKSAEFTIGGMVGIDGKFNLAAVNIIIRNGEIAEYQTPYGVFSEMTSDMQLRNKLDATQRHRITYQDLTKSKSANQIHNLTNNLTCHINSLLTALSMSDLFRQAIKKVDDAPLKYVCIGNYSIPLNLCKCIQEIIEAIDNGSMSVTTQNGRKNYMDMRDKVNSAFKYTDIARMSMDAINSANHDAILKEGDQSLNINRQEEICKNKNRLNSKTLLFESDAEPLLSVSTNCLKAILYEFEQYGIQDVLWASEIRQSHTQNLQYSIFENEATSSPFIFTCCNPSGSDFKDYPMQEVIQDTIKSSPPSVDNTSVFVRSNNEWKVIQDHQIGDRKTVILPNVLCVFTPKSNGPGCKDVQLNDTIEVKDSQGKKKYRLVSAVWHLPGHFVARVKLGDKFYIVDDTLAIQSTAIEENKYFKIKKVYNKDIHLAVYERCD